MIEPEKIKEKILEALPTANVNVEDLTGTRDHFRVRVIDDSFEGKLAVTRHRVVYGVLKEEMKGPIHALAIEAYAPSEVTSREVPK